MGSEYGVDGGMGLGGLGHHACLRDVPPLPGVAPRYGEVNKSASQLGRDALVHAVEGDLDRGGGWLGWTRY